MRFEHLAAWFEVGAFVDKIRNSLMNDFISESHEWFSFNAMLSVFKVSESSFANLNKSFLEILRKSRLKFE